jgi:hypothetical protein
MSNACRRPEAAGIEGYVRFGRREIPIEAPIDDRRRNAVADPGVEVVGMLPEAAALVRSEISDPANAPVPPPAAT